MDSGSAECVAPDDIANQTVEIGQPRLRPGQQRVLHEDGRLDYQPRDWSVHSLSPE